MAAFGAFEFDRRRLRLTRDGARVAISGLPLRILELMLASDGDLITRAQFKQALWPHALRIDTERRLNTAIRALREALGDTAEQPVFIETVRGRGYRWIAPIWASGAAAGDRRRRPMAVAAALALAIVGAGLTVTPRPVADPAASIRLIGLAARADNAAPAGLESLVRVRPDDRAARRLRAQLAVAQWRARPSLLRLAAARQVVRAEGGTLRGDPVLDVLAAELALGGDWDWRGAERLYRRAIAADPDNIAARHGLAWLYANQGLDEKAWAEVAGLMGAARLTPDMRADLGWLLLRAGRADLALDMCGQGQGAPANLIACRHTALAQAGRSAEARDAAAQFMAAAGARPAEIEAVRSVDPSAGYARFLQWRVAAFRASGAGWFQRAQVEAEAGRLDEAMASLEQAARARDPLLVKIATTRSFDRLAARPGYRALVEQVLARA